MILYSILLFLIVIITVLLILFLFYILFPSIKKNLKDITEDPVISDKEKNYIKPQREEIVPNENKAVVLCACDKSFKCKREEFNNEHSCFLINSISDSGTDCKYACIGLGDCAKACPQKAIIIKNRTAVVTSTCIGCGVCVNVCPKNIIKLVPKQTKELTLCTNEEQGLTTCDSKQKVKKLEWNEKKYFKIWAYCYRIIKPLLEGVTFK